jgi:outer membrane biosynthesis protein TonB
MREQLHLDADSVNAFVEGVLPEHERAQCLAHLAECASCRDIVFLAQDVPVLPASPVPIPISAHRRWFQPIPLMGMAAAVCVAIIGAWLYLRPGKEAQSQELAARVTQAPSSPPDNRVETQVPKPVIPEASPSARRRIPEPPAQNPPTPAVTSPEPPQTAPELARVAPVPSPVEAARSKDSSTAQTNILPPPETPAIAAQTEAVTSGISGTVTDQSGAIVPQATIEIRLLAGNSASNARTGPSGQFTFKGLAPGQYELQITAPGFRRTTQRVEVQPQQIAAVRAQLEVGSVSETVEVAAAASRIQTESAQVSNQSRRKQAVPPEPRPLPSKLPTEIMVTRDKVILAVDSAGTLFFSGNSGKDWKAVKSQWTGKVVSVVTPPDLPQATKAQFQLTTDSRSIWLSRDGRRWYSAPPQH